MGGAGLRAPQEASTASGRDTDSLPALSPPDEQFLDEIERAAFRFFWEQSSAETGLVKDRARASGGPDPRPVASIAATGFGLTAICIGAERGYVTRAEARQRTLATLKFVGDRLPHVHGFFYHFVDMHSGERVWNCELSSIDSALLLCGVIACGEYFPEPEIRRRAAQIYERVDWNWMRNGERTLSMGWFPDKGFLAARWDTYCELMMIYLLGLGSPTHPLPAETWEAWSRPRFDYKGIRYINSQTPLFTHQYSHAWFDFRHKRDHYADYFENSVLATKAHRRFCLDLHEKFPDYSADLWGISASDSAQGYVAWGGPPPQGPIDGTLVPCAPGGSIPFLPVETIEVLRTMRRRFGDKIWKRYGFVDAFNPLTGWYDPDVIGIDLGITLLMAENARTQLVWRTFMKNEAAQRGMARASLRRA